MQHMTMEDMTWVELETAIAKGSRTAILAVASIEQHGPALPLNTDAILGRGLASALAEELGDALVAPVVYPGCSDHHLAWPGTLSVTAEVLGEVVGGVVSCLSKAGFTEIILFPSHGGNFDPLRGALPEIRAMAADAEIVDLLDFRAVLDAWFGVLDRHGYGDRTPPHADIIETSMMMCLAPDTVRSERLERGFVGNPELGDLTGRGLDAFTENGVLGDPRGASPELGRDLLEAWVDYAAGEIRWRRAERPGRDSL